MLSVYQKSLDIRILINQTFLLLQTNKTNIIIKIFSNIGDEHIIHLMSELKLNKQLDFYLRAKKQYQNAAKPFTYELNIYSTQPKPKKFMIIINKFIDILKEGMKWEYANQEQLKDNYWNEMQKFYGDTQYEMIYMIDNSYEKKKNKLRLYFGLLLNNKKIFTVIKDITQKLNFMYENPQQKLSDLDKLFEPVQFLKDGQFNIMSDFVNEYQKFEEEKKTEEKIRQKQQAEIERKKQEKAEQARIKQEQLRLQKEKEQKAKQQKERLQREIKEKQAKLKLEQDLARRNKKQTDLTPLDESIAFIPQTYQTQYQHDKSVQLMRRRQENKIAADQLPPWKNIRPKHQKSSEVLFEEKYKDEFQVFSFRLKPDMQNQSKKEHCAECGKQLKQGFYFIGGNQNQCYYTGEWFCNQHMAEQRIAIPWKAIESFDLRGYPVSRKSYIQIKSYYEKPIIEIKNDAPVVKQNKLLYDFLVLKRQIHLIYDSICDLELMEPLLKKKLNYCLKINLFSLKNLYNIYNGHEAPSLQKQYDILSKHFYRCERCQKKKGYVCPKCKDPVKIFAFQLKQTFGCTNCRKLYHRKCQVGGKCTCQQEE